MILALMRRLSCPHPCWHSGGGVVVVPLPMLRAASLWQQPHHKQQQRQEAVVMRAFQRQVLAAGHGSSSLHNSNDMKSEKQLRAS